MGARARDGCARCAAAARVRAASIPALRHGGPPALEKVSARRLEARPRESETSASRGRSGIGAKSCAERRQEMDVTKRAGLDSGRPIHNEATMEAREHKPKRLELALLQPHRAMIKDSCMDAHASKFPFSAKGAFHTSLQRPRNSPPKGVSAESAPQADESRLQRWRVWNAGSWGVAPGWYEEAPLGLNAR